MISDSCWCRQSGGSASDRLCVMTANQGSSGSPGGGRSNDNPATGRRSRAYVWAGSVAGAFVLAIVGAWGTGVGNALWSVVMGHRSPSGAPVKISMDLGRAVADGTFVFPQKLNLGASSLRTLNSVQGNFPQTIAWFRSRGGVEPNASSVKLVVEGNRTYPVQIIAMNVVKHCQQPLNGTLFFSPSAGAFNNIGIGFNLDSVTSTAQNYDSGRLHGDYFATHTISLKQGEVQTLEVVAVTAKQYCQFTLELTVVDGGRRITETVTNDGQPFRVTAVVTKYKSYPYYGPGDLRYYKALYVGGVAPGTEGGWTRKNPETYNDI